MANLTLKGVPELLVDALKKQAVSHRRSLNGEVLYRLEQSLNGSIHGHRNMVRETELARTEIGLRTTVKEILSARETGRR